MFINCNAGTLEVVSCCNHINMQECIVTLSKNSTCHIPHYVAPCPTTASFMPVEKDLKHVEVLTLLLKLLYARR